jgi:hypothetical protein
MIGQSIWYWTQEGSTGPTIEKIGVLLLMPKM